MNVRNLKIIAGKLYREFGDFRPVDMSLSRTIKKRFLLNAPPAVTRRTASEFQTSVPRDLRFVFYEITSLYSRALHNGFFIIFFFFFGWIKNIIPALYNARLSNWNRQKRSPTNLYWFMWLKRFFYWFEFLFLMNWSSTRTEFAYSPRKRKRDGKCRR